MNRFSVISPDADLPPVSISVKLSTDLSGGYGSDMDTDNGVIRLPICGYPSIYMGGKHKQYYSRGKHNYPWIREYSDRIRIEGMETDKDMVLPISDPLSADHRSVDWRRV